MIDLKPSRLIATLALLALSSAGASLARAEATLPSGPVTILEHTQLAGGSFSTALDFLAPAAGKVSVVLTDLVWPEALDSLSFAAASVTSIFGSLSAPGTTSFDVSGPGHYFAIVSGKAKGALDLGLYTLKLQWTAAAPVPLPAAGWLLISGAAGVLGLARRRRDSQLLRKQTVMSAP